MPRGIKGSGKAAKKKAAPRKGAKLEIEQPKEVVLPGDDYLRRDALSFAKELNGGRIMTLPELLADADKVYRFFKGIPQEAMPFQVMKNGAYSPELEGSFPPTSQGEVLPEHPNHKSKFEITM